jgi:hypothetical protein
VVRPLAEIAEEFAAALKADGREPEMVDDAMAFLLDPHPSAGDGDPFVAAETGDPEDIVTLLCDREEIQVVQVSNIRGVHRYLTPHNTAIDVPRFVADVYRTAGKDE